MISNALYIKSIDDENYYFHYKPNEKDKALRFGNRIGIDGLEWIYEHKRYNLFFSDLPYGDCYFSEYKVIIISDLEKTSKRGDLIIYTPTGEIEKVLFPPILPTGKQASGFLEIHGMENLDRNTIPDKFKNGLYIIVWEHEESEWVYSYYFNPETYEFLFFNRSRY